jgi:hypothetical protein
MALPFNKDQSCMPYLSAKKLYPSSVSRAIVNVVCLASVQNFLGWASSVEIDAGKFVNHAT